MGQEAMRLAPEHEVVAIDINPVQLTYGERRFAGDPGFRGRAERIMDFMRFFAPLAGWWPSRLLDLLPKRLGSAMRARMERCFALHPNRSNPYARSLLLGELSVEPPPPEAREVRLVHADAASFLESERPGTFGGITLSNILDGADEAYGRDCLPP